MPYDKSQDIALSEWVLDDLAFSIRKYGEEGTKKFQIGPRVIARPGREPVMAKAGRLDLLEVKFLKKILPEIIKKME